METPAEELVGLVQLVLLGMVQLLLEAAAVLDQTMVKLLGRAVQVAVVEVQWLHVLVILNLQLPELLAHLVRQILVVVLVVQMELVL